MSLIINEKINVKLNTKDSDRLKKIRDTAERGNYLKQKEHTPNRIYKDKGSQYMPSFSKYQIYELVETVLTNFDKDERHTNLLKEIIDKRNKENIPGYSESITRSYLNSLYKNNIHENMYTFEEMICIVSNVYFKFLIKNKLSSEWESYFTLVTNQNNPLEIEQIYNQLEDKQAKKLPNKRYHDLIYTFSEMQSMSNHKLDLNKSHQAMYKEINDFVKYLDFNSLNLYVSIKQDSVNEYLKSILHSYYHLNFLPLYEEFQNRLENVNTLFLNHYVQYNKRFKFINPDRIYKVLDDCMEAIDKDLKEQIDSPSSYQNKGITKKTFPKMLKTSKQSLLSIQQLFIRQFYSNMNKNKLHFKSLNSGVTPKRRKVIKRKMFEG